MNTLEYQHQAGITATYETLVSYPSLGLSDEIGKLLGDLSVQDSPNILKRSGCVLCYLTMLCDDLGQSLREVAGLDFDQIQSIEAPTIVLIRVTSQLCGVAQTYIGDETFKRGEFKSCVFIMLQALATIAKDNDSTLSHVAQMNLEKAWKKMT